MSVAELLQRLVRATDECEIVSYTRQIVHGLGGQWFVFSSLHPNDYSAARTTFRFLIGCRPEWCQIYNERKYFMTDPVVEYARTNTAPISGRDLPIETIGQREMLEVAAINGFRSRYFVPAHGSGKGRIGLLYVGSEVEPDEGEVILASNRSTFRALASELLDWSSYNLKQSTMKSLELTEDDLRILGYVRSGFKAPQVATLIGKSKATVYLRFDTINSKIGVSHIAEAVRFGEAHGFWG